MPVTAGSPGRPSFDPSAFSSNSFKLEWPPKSGRFQHFPEIDRLGWFDYDTGMRKIIAYQQPFLIELGQWLAGKGLAQP